MITRIICIALLIASFSPLSSTFAQPAGGEKPLSPEVAAKKESKFLANIKQITDEGKSGEGYFSPDQKSIIYQSIRGKNPFYQIYIRNLETGKERMVSTGFGRTTCAYFHPSKKRIMFASSHLDPNRDAEMNAELKRLAELRRNPGRRSYSWAFDPFMDIFEADMDGSNLKQLTKAAGYDAEGSWSADGKRIVYCSFRNGNGDLYIMDADGTNRRQLTDSPGYDGGPFFSPDGKNIIFRGEVRARKYLQVFVMPVNGKPGDEVQLTNLDGIVNWGPYWHADGEHIIWSTSMHGHYNYELYWMSIKTKKMQRVTHTMGADVLPVFSPDGKKLMWTSTRGKDRTGKHISQLFIADWVYKGD